ncbi:MFS transporter [Trebonia sp.]|uniref:MFS transporter n=1 Tax=Trebonia sp. TaxID=2767075 RepID=UPI0026265C9F|nr:MFS transporter [Trebonia sp.]
MTTAAAVGVTEPRVNSSARRAFTGAAAALFVLFMGNNLPSALYGLLRERFGFSPLTQTLLYAVPVVAVILPGLLVFGTLSDIAGRRSLVLAGLAAFAAGDLAFMLAGDTSWLFAGRLAQGLGIALATAASTATLSDSAGGLRRDPVAAQRTAALAGTIAITGGLAVGPLAGGLLAQYAPSPRITPLAVHLGLVAAALALAWSIPGRRPRPAEAAGRWRPAMPRIPDAMRPRFRVIAIAELLCWAVLGVFSAVIASLLGSILHTSNLALTAGGLFVAIAASTLAQVGAPRLAPLTAQVTGLSVLACGLVLLLAAEGTANVVLVVAAMVCSGTGHGLVFAGNLAEVTVAAPAAERGAVLGAIYFVNYAGLGVPVIGVGVLSLWTGLETATTVAAIVIAAGCALLIPFVIRRRG